MNPLLFDFEEIKKAYQHEPNPSFETRCDRINRIVRMITENEENLCKAVFADFGQRNMTETRFAELSMIQQSAKFMIAHMKEWMKPISVDTPLHLKPSQSALIPQSKGVIGIMSPWNYPLQLALIPAIAAFAAGNRIWLKPSERSPRTSGYLASLIGQYFHPSEFSVTCGDGEVAAQFSALPFDHLFFTGSTATGKVVMRAAADNLTPLTLELGGKSPCIIDPSAKLSDAASRIVYGKLLNAGQTCVAPDYLITPNAQLNELIAELKKSAQRMFTKNEDLTFPIDERQLDRWQYLVNDAVQKGATAIPLFEAGQLDGHPFIPTIILNPSSASALMNEEIFGPILPIIGYDHIDEVTSFIGRYERPLAMYWFGKSKANLKHILEVTHAGGVTINDTLLHLANEHLPFGGIGHSGMGSYHGKFGFDTFTHYKPVLKTKAWLGMRGLAGTKLLHPPYGKTIETLLKFLNR